MSSYYTTVTINDQEWAEIQRKVTDTNTYVMRKQEEAARIRSEIQKREQELNRMREQANTTVNNAVSALQNGFKAAADSIIAQSCDSVQAQVQGFNDAVAGLRKDIAATSMRTAEASVLVANISQKYAEVVDTLVKQKADSAASAGVYLENISSLNKQIQDLNPQIFDPRGYSEVENIILNARGNIEAGRYQSALGMAQFGILKASALLTKLILANSAHEKELTETTHLAYDLKTEFDCLDSSTDGGIEFEIDGEQYEYDFDIDHWSEGRFRQLLTKFEEVYKQIKDARDVPVPAEQLADMKSVVQDLSQRLKKCDVAARTEMVGSLKAQETAARLCESLMENDWELGEYGFDQGDNRNPYTMIYQNDVGNKISIVVAPGAQADKPNIFLEAFAGDESHADIVKKNVLASLPNEGLCGDTPTQRLNDCQNNKDANTFIRNTLSRTASVNSQRRKKSFGA